MCTWAWSYVQVAKQVPFLFFSFFSKLRYASATDSAHAEKLQTRVRAHADVSRVRPRSQSLSHVRTQLCRHLWVNFCCCCCCCSHIRYSCLNCCCCCCFLISSNHQDLTQNALDPSAYPYVKPPPEEDEAGNQKKGQSARTYDLVSSQAWDGLLLTHRLCFHFIRTKKNFFFFWSLLATRPIPHGPKRTQLGHQLTEPRHDHKYVSLWTENINSAWSSFWWLGWQSVRLSGRFFIYVAGGVTFSELRTIYQLPNKEVILGSANIWKPVEFVESLRELSQEKQSQWNDDEPSIQIKHNNKKK